MTYSRKLSHPPGPEKDQATGEKVLRIAGDNFRQADATEPRVAYFIGKPATKQTWSNLT